MYINKETRETTAIVRVGGAVWYGFTSDQEMS
jgi:hypothetical protein